MNIAQVLTEQSALRPDAAAIIDAPGGRARTTTFAEMERTSGRVAGLLKSLGLQPGDTVLVLQPMSPELYMALVALFRLGLVAAFLDPSAGRDHVARSCEIAKPRLFIGSAKARLLLLLVPELRHIPHKLVIGATLPGSMPWSRVERYAPVDSFHQCDEDTPALLTFTSGSTGRPKAAMRTHGFLLAQHRALDRTIGLPAGVIELATLPVFALANLAAGLTSVIPDADLRSPGKVDPGPILAQIEEFRPTRAVGSPAFFDRIADRCLLENRKIPNIEHIYTGGAPVFPKLLDKLRCVAPNANIVAVYGSTEAEPIAEIALNDITSADRAAMLDGSGLLAGPPVSVVNLKVLSNQWGTPVGPYTAEEFANGCAKSPEPGEIVVSGDHVLHGYLNGEGDEETKFRVDGKVWHRTGDAGCLDADGRLWLLGRCSAIVRDEKGTLYPFAVECAAMHQPAVRRAALVSRDGRRVLAVEAERGVQIDQTELIAALGWAKLDRVIPLTTIPVDKRHNAKVDYPALNKLLKL